jgi:hypothetical protein
MTAAGTYAKAGLLLGIMLVAAPFGWTRVEIISRTIAPDHLDICRDPAAAGPPTTGAAMSTPLGSA